MAYQLLYNLEIAYLAVIAVGVAVLGSRAAPASAAPGPASRASVAARAIVATGLASYVALSWWASHRIGQNDIWPGPDARAYVAQVNEFMNRSERLGSRPALVDAIVPQPVMYPAAGPWTSHSEVFPVLDEDVTFDVGGRELFEITSDGSARPVTFVSDAGGAMSALLGLGVMDFDASKVEVRDGALCSRSGETSEPISMAVPGGAGGDRPYLLLHHSSRQRRVAAFMTEPAGGGPLGLPRFIWLKGGALQHENVFTLPEGPLQRLFIILGPRADLCLSRIEIGRLTDRQ